MSLRTYMPVNRSISEGKNRRALKYFTYLLYVFLYSPIVIVIILSFTSRSVPTFPIEDLSLKWYAKLVPPNYDAEIISALFTSLKIAVVSSIGAGILGTATAFGMTRGKFQSRFLDTNILSTLFLTPLIVPWVVTGIAVLTFYEVLNITGTFYSIVLGHILITLPFVVIVVSTQLYNFDNSLIEAAENLGASKLRTFYEVTLPIVSPGIIAGMLFAFTMSFDNFTQTFFWTSTEIQTLPIVIYSSIKFGLDPTINAISTIIVIFSTTIALFAEKLSSRLV